MLYLNLISSDTKKKIEWRRLYEVVRGVAAALAVFCVVITVFLWGVKKILQDSFQKDTSRNMSAALDLKQQDMGIDLGNRLQSISRIDNEFVPWSYFLAEVAEDTNDKIAFTSLRIDKEKGNIQMRGKAEQRDALLEFKQNMESSDSFSKIIFPVENILKEKNVDFNIKAEPKLDKFQ